MTVFFTADTHFFHKRLLTLGKGRPFKTIEEMNQALITNWNKKVKNDDIVYHLGDFAWGLNSSQTKELLDKLNGKKVLVYGNHDRLNANYASSGWSEIINYKELVIDGKTIVLFHYPMAEWNHAYNGSIHLHGHTHNTFDFRTLDLPHKNKNILDVGVDNCNYEPISWEEVLEKLKINV